MSLQKILRPLTLALLFIIPLFPLIVMNSFFFPFITGKAFYFRILVELAFASWIILAFIDARYRPRLTPISIGVTVFLVVTLLADLLGVNPIRSIVSNFERMEGWLVIAHLWAFYVVATGMFGSGEDGRRMWHRWLKMSLAVAFIIAMYGLFQIFGWANIHQGSSRIDASLGNAAYMAVYLLMHAGISTYLFALTWNGTRSKLALWTYGILAVFFSYLIFETGTRGTILGLVGGVMLALLIYALFARGKSKKSRWISAGVLALVVLIGVVFWTNRNAPFIEKHETLQRLASISWGETRTQARGYVWPMAIEGWKERPVLGWGQENFNYIFNAEYNPLMWRHEQWFDRAHNVYLDWLIAGGVIGLISYLALYVLLFAGIWRNSSLTIGQKCVLTGLAAGYAVHNVFVFDNLASYALFFALLGFTNSMRDGRKLFGTRELSKDAVGYIVAPAAIVLLLAVMYFVNVRPIRANAGLIDALQACANDKGADIKLFEKILDINSSMANQEIREQLIQCSYKVLSDQYPNPVKQAFLERTVKEINAQMETVPNDTRMYAIGGIFLMQTEQYDEAIKALERARELSPGKQTIKVPLGAIYLYTGENDKAIEILKETYESDPTYPEARMAYATALTILGREAEARSIMNNDPEIFDSARMAEVYASMKQFSKAIAVYRKLIAASPDDVNLRATLAQLQYNAGMIEAAVETLRAISADRPEYKDQIDAAIKQMRQ